jgi:hypothetical protein
LRDYLEEMVSLTRSRYPEARIELADARDLSVFADSTFGLAFFSGNGVDGVAHLEVERRLRLRAPRPTRLAAGCAATSTAGV